MPISRHLLGAACGVVFVALMACSSHDTRPTVGRDTQLAPPSILPSGEYPPGPYGFEVGKVIPNITVEGYVSGVPPWTSIAVKDYYDPGGQKGIRGLYVTASAPWCGGCQLEGKDLPGLYLNSYKARGARLLTMLLQGSSHEPASQATVDAWVTAYRTPYDLGVVDSALALPPRAPGGGTAALPFNYVVDPRTMKITQINMGEYFNGDTIPGLDSLLATNRSP